MFHVSFCFHHLLTEQERFTKRNSNYMLLWHQMALTLQEAPIYREAFKKHPNMPFFFQRIFNAISFSREVPCKVFLLCYSPITQSIAMDNLKNRQLTIRIEFVNTIEKADIVISELDLPNREISPEYLCFVKSPFDRRDWKNIENTIIKWRTSE